MHPTPLEQLVALGRKGDLEAFSEIVRRLHGQVRGLIAMMTVAPDWVDDIAQETFIEVYRSLDRVDLDRPFLKWVRGITRNIVRRHEERQAKESKLRQDAVSALVRARRAEAGEGGDTALDALQECLKSLPGHLREILRLRYADEKSSVGIAQVVGRSPDAVRMSLMRARALLLECIQSRARKAEAPA